MVGASLGTDCAHLGYMDFHWSGLHSAVLLHSLSFSKPRYALRSALRADGLGLRVDSGNASGAMARTPFPHRAAELAARSARSSSNKHSPERGGNSAWEHTSLPELRLARGQAVSI